MFIHVAVPVPALDLLTYRVPDAMPAPAVGARVVVPLGSRTVTGIVVARDVTLAGVAESEIKSIRQVLDDDAFLPADVVALARWTAEYYAAGPGETITAVLPPTTRGARADAHKTMRVAAITAAGLGAIEEPSAITTKQRETLDILAGAPYGLPTSQLAARGLGAGTVSRLAASGLVSLRQDRVDRDPFEAAPFAAVAPEADRRLTIEQEAAFARLRAMATAGRFGVALVHGVTGSGKTEIYLRLAAAVHASGRGVLMLVPEIALTPAIASIFRQTFGDRVAIQHSGLSEGERHDQWQRIRRGDIDVVVGTRSAVFAPLDRVGLIVVDEEHDSSYKQEEAPRYNGRDVAIVRAQPAGAPVVLGSATPSMESYHNAITGKY